jgi:hypothetical protein
VIHGGEGDTRRGTGKKYGEERDMSINSFFMM